MRISIVILFVLFAFACHKVDELPKNDKGKDFSQFTTLERDSIAEDYNAWANYFLQPSFAYRLYKDSANLAQPKELSYLQTKSYSYKKRGEHIEAMRILNEVVEKDIAGGSFDALQYRAWSLLYYYRDYSGALEDQEKIEEMTDDNYTQCWGEPCQFQKGQALYCMERYKEAIIEMQNLIEIEFEKYNEVNNHLYFLYLGRCYQKLGNFKEAKKTYLKAIAIFPKFCEGYYFLGEVYEQVGEKKEAERAYVNAEQYKASKMGEPYIERFDEVFPYMIERKLKKFNL